MSPCLQYRFSFFISLYLNINFSMQLPDISICSIFSLQCSYRNHCVHLLSKRYSLNNYQLICNFPGFLLQWPWFIWPSKFFLCPVDVKNEKKINHLESQIHKILQNLGCKNFFLKTCTKHYIFFSVPILHCNSQFTSHVDFSREVSYNLATNPWLFMQQVICFCLWDVNSKH